MTTPEQESGSDIESGGTTTAPGGPMRRRRKKVQSKAVPDSSSTKKTAHTRERPHVAKPTTRAHATRKSAASRRRASNGASARKPRRPSMWARFWDGLSVGTSGAVNTVSSGLSGANTMAAGFLSNIGARMEEYYDEMCGNQPIALRRNIAERVVLLIGKWSMTIIAGVGVVITNGIQLLTVTATRGAAWVSAAAFASVVEASSSFANLLINMKRFLFGEGLTVTEERKGKKVRFVTQPA